jgi:hypothetical protein
VIHKPPFVRVGEFALERTRAYRLMWKYGLTDWDCEVESLGDGGTRRGLLGNCDFARTTIRLDISHVHRGPWRFVRETILHEIAHALVGPCGHGLKWQRKARELGVSESDIKFHDGL